MASRDEQADILGGPILQRPESGVYASFTRYYLRPAILLGLVLLVWIACARGIEHLKKHRELKYRKAMRRKHGIPDSDCRPFAVAYAAAKRAHLEREAQRQKKTANDVPDHNSPVVGQRTNTQNDACLRRRVPEATRQHHDYHHSGKHAAVYHNKPPEVHSLDFSDHYNPDPCARVCMSELPPTESPPVRRASGRGPVINLDDNEESRKRSFEYESDVEHETIKKSRVEDEELTHEDERATWDAQYSDRPSRRASKKFVDQQSDVHMNGQGRLKRVDNLRNEDHEHDTAMEGIDEDEVTELKAVARGKKRDRAEAGSTFGGDDDDDIQNGRASHHRKRRTILRRSEIPTRGQKRDREDESPESENGEVGSEISPRRAPRSSKKKRGKKTAADEISAEDCRISEDPRCSGRRIGENWEADGVRYKVGEKGERLRLTLVKKARNKYHMPQDSQHPDRSAALDIYVEVWLTEEQYKQAEGRQELVWQEASRESSESRTPDVLDSPMKNGKNLLWDSVKCSPARHAVRQFSPAGASTRINPFEQWQPQHTLGRRVASSGTTVSPVNPSHPGFRSFSKWEKQDREAEAMARMRAKMEEQKKAQTPPQKSVEIPASTTAPELGTKLLSVPTITLTPAPAVAAERKSDDSKLDVSTFAFATPSTSDSVKDTATATSPGFSLASTSIPATIPSTLFPSTPAVPTAISVTGSLPVFSSVKQSQVPSSTTTTGALSHNILGKGIGASTLSSSTSTQSPPKPNSSFFAKPDISSFTTSPAVVTPPATEPENSVSPPTSASATAPESSRQTVPLFSFSGTSSPASTALSRSSVPSAPKFSFGQPSTTSPFAPGSSLVQGTTSQHKPSFKLGQTPPSASSDVSPVPATDGSKKLSAPVSVFGTATGSSEPTKPSPFGAISAFGNSAHNLPSAPVSNLFGKPSVMSGDSSISASPKLTLTTASAIVPENIISSTSTGTPVSSNQPVFSFSGTNSDSKPTEEPRSTALFRRAADNPMAVFSGNSYEGKPSFTFSTSTGGSKPTFTLGGNTENTKPTSAIGGFVETLNPTSMFGGVTGPKSTLIFSGATESKAMSTPATDGTKPMSPSATASDSSTSASTADPSKHIPAPGTTFTPFSASPFMFGKNDTAASASTSTSTQTNPVISFSFGVPSTATGSMSDQPTALAASSPGQSVFSKLTNSAPNTFGLTGIGPSSSSNTFTFGKPTAQNQKQEQ